MAGLTPQAQADIDMREKFDASPLADTIREACKKDFRFFYLNILDVRGRGLGKLHDFYIDFKRVHELDQIEEKYRHSPIHKYLPARNPDGTFQERWIYFPTLDSEPIIQDGPEGKLKDMHTSPELWRGVLVRVAGDGRQKCELMPRGHLKTELGVVCWPLWEAIRDPSLRTLIRCETGELASARVLQMETHMDDNERFQKYFGNIIPTGKDRKQWNQSQIQVICSNRRGREPTITAAGITSSRTGFHYDRIILDDVVGESNTDTPEAMAKVRTTVQKMAPLGDPDHMFNDVGTKWGDSDAHAMYITEAFEQSKETSFLIATVRDAEDKLIWPEYTEKQLAKMRASLSGDFDFFCQFYNQPIAGALEKFDEKWINWYNKSGNENPVLMVIQKKLDILMTVDPASTVEKRSDYSACCVQGQGQDGVARYLLGGFREKIRPEDLPRAIVDAICKWQDVAIEAKVSFRFGIEEYSFQTFLKKAILDELRKRGRSVNIQPLKPFRRRKSDRIKVLMTPFMAGRYNIPVSVRCSPMTEGSKGYDLIEMFLEEFKRFPTGTHDDFLDAMAYGEELMRPAQVADLPPPAAKYLDKDRYFRDVPEDMIDPEEKRATARLGGSGFRPTRNSYIGRKLGAGPAVRRDADFGRGMAAWRR